MAQAQSPVAILSIGDMGVGLAKLLIASGLTVITNVKGRSEDTAQRARNAGVGLVDSDEVLVSQSSLILSVVPPRDAVATAQRVVAALPLPAAEPSRFEEQAHPLYYADLNAISPAKVLSISSLFSRSPVRFVDGCILGGPPAFHPADTNEPSSQTSTNLSENKSSPGAPRGWSTPSIPTSGPFTLSSIPEIGDRLSRVLGENHISKDIGAASGLKMCFASLSKGFTAIATESFTTAHRLNILPHLQAELSERLPHHLRLAERSVVNMPPKAYRWVHEMEEISATFAGDGGFSDEGIFRGATSVYRTVTEDTVLGEEKIGKRKRGTTVEDVATAISQGLEMKRKKRE